MAGLTGERTGKTLKSSYTRNEGGNARILVWRHPRREAGNSRGKYGKSIRRNGFLLRPVYTYEEQTGNATGNAGENATGTHRGMHVVCVGQDLVSCNVPEERRGDREGAGVIYT